MSQLRVCSHHLQQIFRVDLLGYADTDAQIAAILQTLAAADRDRFIHDFRLKLRNDRQGVG